MIKHIRNLHDETLLRTIVDGLHELIAVGKDLEVIWSIEYARAVKDNGVTTKRLQQIEDTHFSNIPKENRVMPKFTMSTDVAEQRGLRRGREQIVLAMLRSKMSEQEILKIVGLSTSELANIKKKL